MQAIYLSEWIRQRVVVECKCRGKTDVSYKSKNRTQSRRSTAWSQHLHNGKTPGDTTLAEWKLAFWKAIDGEVELDLPLWKTLTSGTDSCRRPPSDSEPEINRFTALLSIQEQHNAVGSGFLRNEAIASPTVNSRSFRHGWRVSSIQMTLTMLHPMTAKHIGGLYISRQCSSTFWLRQWLIG